MSNVLYRQYIIIHNMNLIFGFLVFLFLSDSEIHNIARFRVALGRHKVGAAQTLKDRTLYDSFMLEYLYLICLLCLTISVPILIRGCFSIHKELPTQGGGIAERIDKVADLLDEMADLINNAIRFQEEIMPAAQTASHPLLSALNLFMNRTPSNPEHGNEKKQTEREIYEIIEPQTTQTENESS